MAYDTLGMLRASSAGNLTATGNTAGLQIDGTPFSGVFLRVHVPQATGTSPTLDITIQESADNSAWRNVVIFPQITAAGPYRRIYASPGSFGKYVRAAMTVGGTTPNFGAVQIGIETGSEYRG